MERSCPPDAHRWDWEIEWDDAGMATCVGVCRICHTRDDACNVPQDVTHSV